MRTISLHNTRYEFRCGGSELWVIEGARETVLASVGKSADGGGWEIRSLGVTLGSFAEERTAREVFEATVERLKGSVTELT